MASRLHQYRAIREDDGGHTTIAAGYFSHKVVCRRILIDVGKAALAAFVMAGAILAFKSLIDPGALFLLVGGGLIGVVVYFGVALLLGIEEIRTIPMAMLKKTRQ